MMVQDQNLPPRRALSGPTRDLIRDTLLAYSRQPADDESLRVALAQAGAEARTLGIPAEELLIELKQLWSSLPNSDHRSAFRDTANSLQQVVTICIKEYYRAPG